MKAIFIIACLWTMYFIIGAVVTHCADEPEITD